MGFASVTFRFSFGVQVRFGFGLQVPHLGLCAEREDLAFAVLSHFACQFFVPQLTDPFPTFCTPF
jgi:hypothetical protein